MGIIGLSARGGWAATAHLPYLRRSSKYTITAVANKSRESSEAAISAHGLAVTTKAYGTSKELADDPAIDLIVCCADPAHHFEALREAVDLSKDVYCEWPLGNTIEETELLNKMAKDSGSKTIIGLQGHHPPVVAKLKELISQDKIGRVLSSTIVGPALRPDYEEVESAGNHVKGRLSESFITHFFSHSIDSVLSVLGELKSYHSMLDIREPESQEAEEEGGSGNPPEDKAASTDDHASGSKSESETKPTEESSSGSNSEPTNESHSEGNPSSAETPASENSTEETSVTHCQVMFQAYLVEGGILSYHMHGGRSLPSGDGLRWRIGGEKGELTITAPDATLQSTPSADVKIRLYESATGRTEDIPLPTDQWDELPIPAQNVARLYEAFADDRTKEYPDWEHAVLRHKIAESIGTTSGHTVVLRINVGHGASQFRLLPPNEFVRFQD